MSSLKSALESTCGQSPLLNFSNNYGQSQPQIKSGVEKTIVEVIPKSTSEHGIIQEYLDSVTNETTLPGCFDVQQLVKQLNKPHLEGPSRVVDKDILESTWKDSRTIQSNKWTTEFLAKAKQPEIQLTSSQEYEWHGQDNKLLPWTHIHNETEIYSFRHSSNMSGDQKTAMTARDFLEQFDKLESCPKNMTEDWIDEFLYSLKNYASNIGDEVVYNQDIGTERMEYNLCPQNPYEHEINPIEKGNFMTAQGRINDAILYYEAHLKQNSNSSEIWYKLDFPLHKLGLCHAENGFQMISNFYFKSCECQEVKNRHHLVADVKTAADFKSLKPTHHRNTKQDQLAIQAFNKSLEIDSSSRRALLALSVSLINESYDQLALDQLKKWIFLFNKENLPEEAKLHDQYSAVNLEEFAKVENKFLETLGKNQESIDAELQNAMSVLYNLYS